MASVQPPLIEAESNSRLIGISSPRLVCTSHSHLLLLYHLARLTWKRLNMEGQVFVHGNEKDWLNSVGPRCTPYKSQLTSVVPKQALCCVGLILHIAR
ncbi:hypothetical protein J6590_058832 [Homalodisca vitripennis]|nr:hypothetical protein J6590_058832 [Homalodisca vitripennis]